MNGLWLINEDIGIIKQHYYTWLQKKFHFDSWHIVPINQRQYAIDIIYYLNKQIITKNGYIVEVGCGLGDIIGNINYPTRKKIGLDKDLRVISGAKAANPFRAIYKVGSFDNINQKKISLLITVNFIHNIEPTELKHIYMKICKENCIERIVLDVVKSKNYLYNHNGEYLLKDLGYTRAMSSRPYRVKDGIRKVEVWERNDIYEKRF